MLRQAGRGLGGTSQGNYLFDPDGKLLAFANTADAAHVKRLMDSALKKFAPVAREAVERPKAPVLFEPPAGGLVIDVTAKVLGGYEKGGRTDPAAQEALALRQAGQTVVEVTDPQQAARMLHGGRVLAWYEIDLRVHYLWRSLGYAADGVQTGEPVASTLSYIAGSPVLADAPALSQGMRQAFAAMRGDGSWRRILARHLGDELAARLAIP